MAMRPARSTTILSVRRDGQVALGGDGQVTLGNVVAKQDAMIAPQAEEAMAKGITAKVTEVDSGHVAMLSKPREVAEVILNAAAAVN